MIASRKKAKPNGTQMTLINADKPKKTFGRFAKEKNRPRQLWRVKGKRGLREVRRSLREGKRDTEKQGFKRIRQPPTTLNRLRQLRRV